MLCRIITLLVLFVSSLTQAQNSLNMEFLARWDQDTLPIANPGGLNLQYSGCWGLVANGLEIAVIGGARHVFFFDVTQPKTPKLIGKFAGNQNTIWREFKSYKNRLYAVSDGTEEGLMIFDCSKAPDIKRTYWSNEFFKRSHTITLDTISGRIYLNGTDTVGQGMAVLSVKANPDKPSALPYTPKLKCNYIHDSYVRNDTIYASSGWDGYCIYDFKDPANAKFLAALPATGYNHNSWLTKDGRYAYYTDEIPRNRPIQVVDLKNLAFGDIRLAKNFLNPLMPTDTPNNYPVAHNVYIKNHLLFNSQYEDGLLVYDITSPLNPVLLAYYDTHPQNSKYTGYFGNWGNYPWLPSGTIITSDMQNGLTLLRLTKTTDTRAPEIGNLPMQVYPNPAADLLYIELSAKAPIGTWHYRLLNTAAQVVLSENNLTAPNKQLDINHLPTGMYWLEVVNDRGESSGKKVMKQ